MKSIFFCLIAFTFLLLGYFLKKNNIIQNFHSYLKHSNTVYDEDIIHFKFNYTDKKFDDFTEDIRSFINSNSIRYQSNQKRYYDENDSKKVVDMMLNFHNNQINPPQLSCSSRASAMQEILKVLGVKSRLVNLFSENSGSHSFLEVLNPNTNQWILEDPDYNIAYKFINQDKKVSLADLVTSSNEDFHPCRGAQCSWSFADNLKNYTGAALFYNFDHSPVIFLNQKKFKVNTVLKWDKKKRNIIDYVNDIWGDNITEAVTIIIN